MYFHVPAVAEAVAEAGLRARVGHGVVTVGKDEAGAAADVEEGLAVLDAGDGLQRVETAVMPHSLTTVGEDHLATLIEGARAADVPVHLHANETAGEVDPIVEAYDVRPLAYASNRGLLGEGDFLAHGVHVDDSEVGILADSGAGVVHCPASNMKLASGMAPVQRLLDAGVTVGLGTDGAASNNDLDLFGEMRDAALLGKLAAEDASAVAARSALRMATEGSAACAGLPVGRLAPGGPADCIVVDLAAPHLTPDHDLVSHLVYAARGSDVRHTVCDGRVLMRDRELLTLDEPAVRATADRRARALTERAAEEG
jgi:5-methylthioadenosine/S-adenosylhomocysteine deaminase